MLRKYKVATLRLEGDEGRPCYSNIEEIEAVSEKQAIFFYEKKHHIPFMETFRPHGRSGVIYDPLKDPNVLMNNPWEDEE